MSAMLPPRSMVELDARIGNLLAAVSGYATNTSPTSSDESRHTDARRYQRIVNRCLVQSGTLLNVDIRSIELDAVKALLAGSAVEVIDPDSGQGSATFCLLLTGCLLAAVGVSTHLVFPNDQIAVIRFNSMKALIDNLEISATRVTTDSSATDRDQAYQGNLVFCSVKECALDRLRDRKRSGRAANAVDNKLHSLGAAAKGVDDRQAVEMNYARFALVEEIDQLLLDSAMTPVQLFDGDHDPSGARVAGDEVAESASFFGIFSSYGKLAGIGEGLDRQTEKGFSHYHLSQLLIDGVTGKLSKMVSRQEQPMASRIVFLPADQSVHRHLASYLQMVFRNSPTVIVDQIAEEEIETLTNFLRKNLTGIDVSSRIQPGSKAGSDVNPVCVLVTGSMSDMVDGADLQAQPQDSHVHVISFRIESSYRTQLKKYRRVRRAWGTASFDIIITADFAGLSLSPLTRTLLLFLPPPLRRVTLTALIKHHQKEFDRHRARTTESLIRYEKELDDLLAFSG